MNKFHAAVEEVLRHKHISEIIDIRYKRHVREYAVSHSTIDSKKQMNRSGVQLHMKENVLVKEVRSHRRTVNFDGNFIQKEENMLRKKAKKIIGKYVIGRLQFYKMFTILGNHQYLFLFYFFRSDTVLT